MLPHEGSIGIVGLIGPFLGLDEAALDDLPYHHFKGLAVALVQSQQEARQHGEHHNQGRRAASHPAPEQKIKRDAYEKRTAEADQLSFGKAKHNLGFYTGQILWDGHISQSNHLVSDTFSCGVRERSLSTSFPQTSQPGAFCLANSSTRGRSPASSMILSRVTSGFLLCSSTGEIIN